MMLKTVVFAAAIAASLAVADEAAPRYQLKVGQEFVYEGSSTFRYENGSHETTDRVTLWVTSQNADGSWHVVAHSENTFAQKFGTGSAGKPQKDEELGAYDVFPDGRIPQKPEGYRTRALTMTFIPLPANLAAARAGWQQSDELGDTSLYRLAPESDPRSSRWIFTSSAKGMMNEIYLSTSEGTYYFDVARGVIGKVETKSTQGYGFNGKGSGLFELKSVAQKEPEWVAQLASETELFAKVKTDAQSAMKANKNLSASDMVAKAESPLRAARDKAQLPLIQGVIDRQIEQIGEYARYSSESQQEEDAVKDKPAAEWETTDIDGGKHSMSGYRGKVVVLDFWYRGCGWCIRAMPQIKEVADHFRDRPVAILGMNTDREEKDARFVIDKLALNYPTLKATGLPEKYHVRGFPTLIIIDQKGVVRGRHVGYAPDLRETLTKTIDSLLANEKR